jgi:hypothetical protein
VFKELIELGDVFELGSIGGRRSLRIVRQYVSAGSIDHYSALTARCSTANVPASQKPISNPCVA